MFHTSFLKVIELPDGSIKVFDFKEDAIQSHFGGKQIGRHQASFNHGSFIQTQVNMEDGGLKVLQTRVCNAKEFYNKNS